MTRVKQPPLENGISKQGVRTMHGRRAYWRDESDEIYLQERSSRKVRHEGFLFGLVAVGHLLADLRWRLQQDNDAEFARCNNSASCRPSPFQPEKLNMASTWRSGLEWSGGCQ
jgi:hypothetical protein